jgi:hypothetical protein
MPRRQAKDHYVLCLADFMEFIHVKALVAVGD